MIKNFVIFTSPEQQQELQDLIDLVIQPTELDEIIILLATSCEQLAVESGLFPSLSQARKNNFSGPIPFGLSQLGTKKHRFWVWNPNKFGEVTILNQFIHS